MLLDLEAGGSEIEQDRRPVGRTHHDVLGRDVEVPRAVLVHEFERGEERPGDEVEFVLGWQAVEPAQPFLERHALDEVEHHIGGVVQLEHAPHADDVGMVELGQEPRFVEELLSPQR